MHNKTNIRMQQQEMLNFDQNDYSLENIYNMPEYSKTHLQQCTISKIFPGAKPPDPP